MVNTRAITFDSPGSLKSIEGLKSNIYNKYGTDLSNLDIVTYLAKPNIVNTANKHIGKVYSLKNQNEKDNKDEIINHLKIFSLS